MACSLCLVGLAPVQLWPQTFGHGMCCLAGGRPVSGDALVEHERAVDRDLEDAFGAGPQLDATENRRPSRRYLCCHTDSVIEIVSRNAVFDQYFVCGIDHPTTTIPKPDTEIVMRPHPVPVDASGDQVVLTSGRLRLTVVTAGGGIRELTFGERPVIDGYGVDEIALGARGQPLIPWPNRIADGRYEFAGRQYQVPLTEPDKRNALHGFARWMTWNIESRDASSAVLSLLMYPRQGYPFALYLETEYRVDAANVSVITSATNAGRAALPYANGFHPYITVGTPAIDRCRLTIPARTFLQVDERQIPTGRSLVEGTAYDFRAGRPIEDTVLDHAFTDLARDAGGMARVVLSAPEGSDSVAVRMDQAHPYLMVFTGDTLADVARRRTSIAVEPMTAAPNAFRSGEGLRVLQPGETFASEWGIEVT